MFNKNLTIKARLIFVLGALSLALVAIGVLGLHGMSQANQGLLSVYEERTIPISQIAEIRQSLMQQRMLVLQTVNEPTTEVIRNNSATMLDLRDVVSRNWDAYMSSELSADESKLAEQFESERRRFAKDGLDGTMDALAAGRFEEGINAAYEVMEPAFEPLLARANALMELQLEMAQQEYEVSTALYETIRTITITAIVIALLVAGLVGYLLVQAIIRPLNEAVRLANAIADGDLTNRVEVTSNDETGRMLAAMQTMSERLETLVSDVSETSLSVASGANQIAAGNASLSQRTEEQASSLEETASSMEEMTSTVRQSAENAGQANLLANEARESAEKGGAVVARAVDAMSEINRSSKKVADIISVIDEIAFQTNLLALNAAVEAARAGEQGRGFAVVAAEVRNLAQRSASSAKEIKDLIEDSLSKVNQGAELVEHSGETLSEIVSRVKKVTDIVAEIAAASQEQSAGIEQVNKAVMQIDELTQQNAALVEEASASSQAMADQAHGMHDMMRHYRVNRLPSATRPQRAASDGAAAPAPRPHTSVVQQSSARAPAVERRGANRPWSQTAEKATPRPVARAATGTDDADWQEF